MWIEIGLVVAGVFHKSSLPLRECGLKLKESEEEVIVVEVTPFAGVWIEILRKLRNTLDVIGHSLCGSVD